MISVYIVSVQDESGPAWAYTIPQLNETDYGEDTIAKKPTTYTAMSLALVEVIDKLEPHMDGIDGVFFYTNKGKMLEQIFERKGLIGSSISVGALTVKAIKKLPPNLKKKVYLTEHVEQIETLSLHLAGFLQVTQEKALDLIGIEKRAKFEVLPLTEYTNQCLGMLRNEMMDTEIIRQLEQIEAFIKRNGGITSGIGKAIDNMVKKLGQFP